MKTFDINILLPSRTTNTNKIRVYRKGETNVVVMFSVTFGNNFVSFYSAIC